MASASWRPLPAAAARASASSMMVSGRTAGRHALAASAVSRRGRGNMGLSARLPPCRYAWHAHQHSAYGDACASQQPFWIGYSASSSSSASVPLGAPFCRASVESSPASSFFGPTHLSIQRRCAASGANTDSSPGAGGDGASATAADGLEGKSILEIAATSPELVLPAGAAPIGFDTTKPAGAEEFVRAMKEGSAGKEAKRCAGCGAWLQSSDPQEHGYVPAEAREKFSPSGRKKSRKEPMGEPVDWVPDGVQVLRNPSTKYKTRTKLLICQRCYRLQHYHRTIAPVEGGFYRLEGGRHWEHEAEIVEKVVRRLRKGSLVMMVIDILDFESSLVPELFDACRNRKLPVIFVVNKIDCLPQSKDRNYDRVKVWVRRMSRQIRNVHVNDVVLVSALNAYGFKQLEERLRHHLEPNDPKNIYVVGRVNSGKSTFVNRFLWYIGYKNQGTVHFKRTVGGVTRSPLPGTTLHFVSFPLPKGFRLVDTPGIPTKCQVTNRLSEGIDLYGAMPRKKMQPISYVLHTGRSLLVGAIARIDQVKGAFSFVSAFFSPDVTLHVCQTVKVPDLMERKAGEFFYPPHNREDCERLGPLVRHRVEVFGSSDRAWDDIVIAGLGWIAVSGFGTKELDVWVPQGVKVFRRPSLMPQEVRNRGVTRFHPRHRARGHRVMLKKRGMVRARRDKELRDSLREATAIAEAERAAVPDVPAEAAFVEDGIELPPGYAISRSTGSDAFGPPHVTMDGDHSADATAVRNAR